MRATQYFHRGLLLMTQRKEKNFKETHWNIFGVFVFPEESTMKEKIENEKNYIHGKAPNKQKKNEKSFWVFF